VKALSDEDAKAREQLLQEEKKRKKKRGGTPMVTPEAREAANLSAARAYYGMIQ
jgi:ABC-type Fe3+/spermidine/putrescine transport system ATPase subunit